MSLRDLLFRSDPALGVDPAAAAVHAGDESWTWGEVRRRAGDVACALADAGVRAGQPVGVMLPNGIDLVAALFGVWRADAVYVPLNPRLAGPEVDRILATVATAAVVTTEDQVSRFPEHPAVVAGDGGGDRRDYPVVKDRIGPLPPGSDAHAARFGPDVALVQFTSGTTGEPKPVLLNHDGVLRLLDGVVAKIRGGSARQAERAGADTAGDQAGTAGDRAGRPARVPAGERRRPMANLIPVSLSLWAGIYNVLFAFRVGAPVVLMDGFAPGTFAELVRRHGIRSTVLPPAAMTALVDDPEVTDLAPLRLVRSITAPLSPLQARRFKDRFGVAILNSYGQTELGGEIVGWNAADAREHGDGKLGAVGRPHDGVELRIVDPGTSGAVTRVASAAGGTVTAEAPAGAHTRAPSDAEQGRGQEGPTVVPAGEAGELWVRTPAMAAGYADGRDLAGRLSPDGWFRTGDVGRVDDDGFLWIEGRVSDMVNRGGLKVHPAEVEEVLRLSPDVADAAVVGVPDDRLGEVPWAFVVPVAERAPDPEGLAALCREHLAPYKVPVRFPSLDALPRNEVGKVRKHDLVARAVAR